MNNNSGNTPLTMEGNANYENSGVKSDIMSTVFVLLFICLIVGGYHFFVVSPAIEKARIYYVMDLEALMESKASQLIERERNAPTRTQEELLVEANVFRNDLGQDLLRFSNGYPIFQKGTVLRADSNVIDLTPILANHYGLKLPENSQ